MLLYVLFDLCVLCYPWDHCEEFLVIFGSLQKVFAASDSLNKQMRSILVIMCVLWLAESTLSEGH